MVFSENEKLTLFKEKTDNIMVRKSGPDYNFFNAIESFGDVPIEKKIGKRLTKQPLKDSPEFIDIELWRFPGVENFIRQLKNNYPKISEFRITDKLITKSFALLRVELVKDVFDKIIHLKEIARAERPALMEFNPSEMSSPNVNDIIFKEPAQDATGILIIDSGIISNHPMLKNCVGAEENYQDKEAELQDTVGHGTAVAGCAVYGGIESNLTNTKEFTPSNWLFSAKVMYAEKNQVDGTVHAVYDEEKLIEHQFQEAIEDFLTKPEYRIKVVNISLGNSDEIWQKDYSRQLPLGSLIDELALKFSNVVFVVSAGNQSPEELYESIAEITENYPCFLVEREDFRIINPATSALALSVGSISPTHGDNRTKFFWTRDN